MNSQSDSPCCILCNVPMKMGQAIPTAVVWDGNQGSFGAHTSAAPLVNVWKCPKCGHSFQPAPAKEEKWAKERHAYRNHHPVEARRWVQDNGTVGWSSWYTWTDTQEPPWDNGLYQFQVRSNQPPAPEPSDDIGGPLKTVCRTMGERRKTVAMPTPSTIPTPISNEAALKGAYMMSGDFSATQGKQLVHLSVAQDLERKLSIALAALEKLISLEPAQEGGGFFYPVCDGEGNPIGEQHVDPISLVGEIMQESHKALSKIQSLSHP